MANFKQSQKPHCYFKQSSLLLSPPTMHGDNSIVLGSQDYIVFSALRAGCTSLSMSMKESGKWKPKAGGAVVDDDDV